MFNQGPENSDSLKKIAKEIASLLFGLVGVFSWFGRYSKV